MGRNRKKFASKFKKTLKSSPHLKTTVKADSPTVLMESGPGHDSAGKALLPRVVTGFSRAAARLLPGRIKQADPKRQAVAKARLAYPGGKISRRIRSSGSGKTRFVVILTLVSGLAGAGYYGYQTNLWQKMDVSGWLSNFDWQGDTPEATTSAVKAKGKKAPKKTLVKKKSSKKKFYKKTKVTAKKKRVVKKKTSARKSGKKIAGKKRSKSKGYTSLKQRSFNRLSSNQKKKIWKKKLAKLKAESQRRYKRVSNQYRRSGQ